MNIKIEIGDNAKTSHKEYYYIRLENESGVAKCYTNHLTDIASVVLAAVSTALDDQKVVEDEVRTNGAPARKTYTIDEILEEGGSDDG
jgi:hypothetical protein|tara:strand:+ start:620 stop:883 length:264 start_codon:yes stop_codon:yes gene_type:complete